jgi:hypothetical protein
MKGFRLSLLAASELKLVLLDEIPEVGLDFEGESFRALNGRLGGRRRSDVSETGEYGPGDFNGGDAVTFCCTSARDFGSGRGPAGLALVTSFSSRLCCPEFSRMCGGALPVGDE